MIVELRHLVVDDADLGLDSDASGRLELLDALEPAHASIQPEPEGSRPIRVGASTEASSSVTDGSTAPSDWDPYPSTSSSKVGARRDGLHTRGHAGRRAKRRCPRARGRWQRRRDRGAPRPRARARRARPLARGARRLDRFPRHDERHARGLPLADRRVEAALHASLRRKLPRRRRPRDARAADSPGTRASAGRRRRRARLRRSGAATRGSVLSRSSRRRRIRCTSRWTPTPGRRGATPTDLPTYESAHVEASGDVDLSCRTVQGNAAARALDVAMGKDEAQSLAVRASVEGPLAAPELDVGVSALGVVAAGQKLTSVLLTATGPATSSRLAASLRSPDLPAIDARAVADDARVLSRRPCLCTTCGSTWPASASTPA